MKQILAIFDFCETLVDFQSIPPYLKMIARENRAYCGRFRAFRRRFFPRIYKRIHLSFFDYKRAYFEELRGFSEKRAREIAQIYAQETLQKRVNSRIIERVKYHKAQGHRIVIISGGLAIYIRAFGDLFNIAHEDILAIELESQNGILSGNMAGLHTMEYRKLYKLADTLDLGEFDLAKSYFYSDCPSDIPLLSLVGFPRVVECGKDTRWAKILGYEIV